MVGKYLKENRFSLLQFSLFFILVLAVGCAGPGKSDHDSSADPARTPEVERGRYLVLIMGCNDCHTSDDIGGGSIAAEEDWLVGGVRGFYGPWGTVYPTNLRLLLNSISEDRWLALAKQLRENSPMAWSWLPNASDEDLLSLYQFVRYLGPKGSPAPPPLPPGVVPTTEYINFPLPH